MKNMVTDQIVLPPSKENDNRKTLILDLDETLVHSSFSPVDNCDLILPVRFFNLRLKSTTLVATSTSAKDPVVMNSFRDYQNIMS